MDIRLHIIDEQINRISNDFLIISLYIEIRCFVNTNDQRFLNFLRSVLFPGLVGIRAMPIFTISRIFILNFQIRLYYTNNSPDNEHIVPKYTSSDYDYDDIDWQYPED